MCPRPGVELWVKEVRCPPGWALGQVRRCQVGNRLRERRLGRRAGGCLSLQVGLHQKPSGWGWRQVRGWDRPAPLFLRDTHSYVPYGRTRATQGLAQSIPLGGLRGCVHRGCSFTVKPAGAVELGRQILNINPFDI